MEKSAFLFTVKRIVRRVEIQHDALRRFSVRLEEKIDEQTVYCLFLQNDLLMSERSRLRGQLQTIQRALAGERRRWS